MQDAAGKATASHPDACSIVELGRDPLLLHTVFGRHALKAGKLVRRRSAFAFRTSPARGRANGRRARKSPITDPTVFLPKTDFPMKAGLPQKEPAILARWQEGDLYGQVRESRAGREKFILHDGPPYANGDIHIGHALNHILKDMVVRTQTLLGKDAPYVPGWDCHGLPIEWKVEEQYRKKKLNKDEVPVTEFRAECRAYAAALGRRAARAVEAARHRRRLGQALSDDGLRQPKRPSSPS